MCCSFSIKISNLCRAIYFLYNANNLQFVFYIPIIHGTFPVSDFMFFWIGSSTYKVNSCPRGHIPFLINLLFYIRRYLPFSQFWKNMLGPGRSFFTVEVPNFNLCRRVNLRIVFHCTSSGKWAIFSIARMKIFIVTTYMHYVMPWIFTHFISRWSGITFNILQLTQKYFQ